jgi:hypothetical protein
MEWNYYDTFITISADCPLESGKVPPDKKSGTACLRASMLPKKYGWGIHFNSEGKMALVPMESPDYQSFVEGQKGKVKVLAAMRSSKK